MKKTKMICTIGPATEQEEKIEELIKAGMNVARLNFSHGNHEEHGRRIDRIKNARNKLGVPVAILLDTKGPEVRLGTFEGGSTTLEKDQEFILTTKDMVGNSTCCTISYKELPEEVSPEDRILIADGLIELRVKTVSGQNVICRVVNGGQLTDRKNVNIPGATSKLPAITEKDVKDLIFGIEQGVDFIAASFIRKADDIRLIREVLHQNGGTQIGIIAKIENQEGVDNIEEILQHADGIMVARGDLGVELPPWSIPMIQKRLIRKANEMGKPVVTATQMLESMITNPRPTRAEVTDIANSILDGTDAIMLSGETANGKYPIEAAKMMVLVATNTEEQMTFRKNGITLAELGQISLTDSVCHAASMASRDLGAAAILSPSNSGYTPKQLSRFRPKAPIIAMVHDERTARRLCLSFGVESIMIPMIQTTDEIIETSIKVAKGKGVLKVGDTVVICAGIPSGKTSVTNMMKVDFIME